MTYYGMDWIATVLGLASIYWLGHGKRLGFVLRIFSSIFWAVFCYMAGTPAGMIANIIAIVLCLRGLEQWKS
jgi:hypothetical protein